jgi:hypothetical protein
MGREGFGRIGKRSRVHAVLISACYRLAYTHIDPKRPRPCSTLAAAASLSLARPRPDPIHRARQASRRSEDREATAMAAVQSSPPSKSEAACALRSRRAFGGPLRPPSVSVPGISVR